MQDSGQIAINFRTLHVLSGWNAQASKGAFINALNELLKDNLVYQDESRNLEELIALTIRLDNIINERAREHRHKHSIVGVVLESSLSAIQLNEFPPRQTNSNGAGQTYP